MKTSIDNELISARARDSRDRACNNARPPPRSLSAATPHPPPRSSSSPPPPLAEERPVRYLIRRLEEITVDFNFNDQGEHHTRGTGAQESFERRLLELPIHPTDGARQRRRSESSFERRSRHARALHPFAFGAILSGLSSTDDSAECSDCEEE